MVSRALLAILLVSVVPACAAPPEPTPATRTITVKMPVPVADKAVIDAAREVFAKRLKALGIVNFTMTVGATMEFALQVPLTFDGQLVDAVLKRPGVVALVSWPPNGDSPAPGDTVPATVETIVAAGEFTSAVASSDATGQPAVRITLGAAGAAAFATYTAAHIGGYAPLVLDGTILTAPIIQSAINGGDLLITGPDPLPIPVAALAAIMASGPLPDAWTYP